MLLSQRPDEEGELERLGLYALLTSGRNPSSGQDDSSPPLQAISEALLVVEWTYNEYPIFELVHRAIIALHNQTSALETFKDSSSDCPQLVVQLNTACDPTSVCDLKTLKLQYETTVIQCPGTLPHLTTLFRSIDRSSLPTRVRMSCSCDWQSYECQCSQDSSMRAYEASRSSSVAFPSPSLSYTAILPQTRDLAAEVNRLGKPFIMRYGSIEIVRAAARAIERRQPTIRFVEVGAHFGDASLFAASLFSRAGLASEIFSYEPNPIAFDVFDAAVRENGFESMIKVSQLAIGAENGESVFAESLESSVHSSVGDKDPFGMTKFQKFVVPQRRLDDDMDERHTDKKSLIDLLMIHTNGAEIEVLIGSLRLFEERRVRRIKLRFYSESPAVVDGRTFTGHEKWKLLNEILVGYGCGPIQTPESDNGFVSGIREGAVIADCLVH